MEILSKGEYAVAQLDHVSADTSEKEKVVGGVLTMAQGLWLAGGILIFGGIFMLLPNFLPIVLAVPFALVPGLAFGLPFAFYKKEGIPLFTYLTLKKKFEKKSKYLINDLHYEK